MDAIESNEIWQVEVGGKIYQAALTELPSWIAEGSLQPADKVRKGNLRWIDAARVPSLAPMFEAKANGERVPELPVQTLPRPTDVTGTAMHDVDLSPRANSHRAKSFSKLDPNVCSVHSDREACYICENCTRCFCKVCPKSFGGSIKICPNCDSLCKPVREHRAEIEKQRRTSLAQNSAFGAADFYAALKHPFRFKFSLFVGAVMFTAFSLGRGASAIGGAYLFVSAVLCLMLANMLTFGVLANTVDKFSRGELDENFMPDFEDFTIWDDVVHPFVLSVGVYISSFGAFALVAIVGFYMVSSQLDSKNNAIKADLEKIPGTQFYAAKDTVKQSDDVRALLADTERLNAERLEQQQKIANGDANAAGVDQESRGQEELWRAANESRKTGLESVLGRTAETRERENDELTNAVLSLPAPLVVVGFIALLWGLFYYPAACVVAGYTRSFRTTIDPLIGLDTIKHLGANYAKLLLMGALLLFASTMVGWIANAVLAPFDLPGLGNLPANAISSFVGFYLFVVFSCVIGYGLFKSADRLQLLK